MELLERDEMLVALDGCLTDAAAGDGRLVLLAGEAGIGKTALARTFVARHRTGAVVWWGACDALQTPSPLAPLHDMARDSVDLAGLLAGDPDRQRLFAGVLDLLVSPLRPVIMVIEDVHWADDATLDLLIFLGRRITGTHAIMVVTYRDDELGPDHPLRRYLGSLAGLPHRRFDLPRLSEPATAALASGRNRGRLFQVTGGNPFFVTALLSAPDGTVPVTVRDAVLARVARLSPPARATLDAVAVVPGGVELALLGAVCGGDHLAGLDECSHVGLLEVAGGVASFRHELARQAVAEAVPKTRASGLHQEVLRHLAARPDADPARLAFHASQAHDRDAVLRHAPAAAAEASRFGAHREAVAHFQAALPHLDALPTAGRVEVLEGYAEECSATGRLAEAIDVLERIALERQALDEPAGSARALLRRAGLLYAAGRSKEAYAQASGAMALVEGLPPSPALASAYAHAAYLQMVRHERSAARDLGARAAALAERFDDHQSLAIALVAAGSGQWESAPAQAESALVRAVEAAHASGRAATVTLATGALGVGALAVRRYQTADRWLLRAVDWCLEHDLDTAREFYQAGLAESHFEQGRWPEAAQLIDELTRPDGYPPAGRIARRLRARLAVRRGDPHRALLAEAWEVASGTGDLARLWPVAAGRAEAAWQAGRAAQIPGLVADTYQLAVEADQRWAIGELGFWLWRAGRLDHPPERAAEPYALHMGGDPLAAAAAWDSVGCPYEAALARADSDVPDQLRAALAVLYRLGARPAANRLARRMRAMGVTGLPRRPHRATGGNPAGLTDREMEIVGLVAAGLSNADIAAALHISRHTTAHHVSAALSKLGVGSRRAAAQAAQRLGVAAPDRSVERPP
jgi:DNA-binding CsgD family transcriptional regulator